MNRLACLWIGLGGLALVGCGDDGDVFGEGGGGGDTTAASTSNAASTSQSGSANSSSSGSGTDDRIDPIALGRSWTYEVEEIGTFAYCPSGSHTGETIAEVEKNGKQAFEVTSLCQNLPSSLYAVEGDVVFVDYQDTWVLALDAPVEEGHTWSNGASTFTWHDEGSVTVPAGTFDDCWRATQNVAYEAYTIFCRGVGPVHWRSVDLTGNGFDAVLTAKNF
jgi:hypothetical protein